MSLLRAHKSVFEVVRAALDANPDMSHIKASIGTRFQAEQNPEIIIQQNSFDINDLNTQDFNTFEISVYCYSNSYTEAASVADHLFNAVRDNEYYILTETEEIEGSDDVNVSTTPYHLRGLDLFLEYYDEDGYEANILIRAIEAADTVTGVGTPDTGGSPAPFFPQSESRIQDLSDVNVSTLAEGNILKYDFDEGEWVNGPLPIITTGSMSQTTVGGFMILDLVDSPSFNSIGSSNDIQLGGDLLFSGTASKLIRPNNVGSAAGPLTIQSNGDLVIELDEDANEPDKALIVKNGADEEVFRVDESGSVTVNDEYELPTTDGGSNYFLKTDGNGQLYFATLYGTSGNTGGSPPPAIDTVSELLDTDISSLSDNQILRYDSASSKWVNEDLTLAQSIGDLTDVDTTTTPPANGQALVWNNANSEWEAGDVGIDGLVTSLDGDDVTTWRPRLGEYGVDTSAADDGSLNLALGEGHPRDLYFKPDGTKCYIVGNGLDDIHEAPLATAWDLQSAVVANVVDVNLAGSSSIGGGGHEGNLYGIHIADDATDSSTYGKKFFVIGSQRDEVQEYTATAAWDASTISTAATNRLYVGSQDANPSALRFTPDGQTLYVLDGDNDATPRCRVWDLTTAWDLSTATYNSSKDITFPTVDRNARGLDFNSDGSVVYITTTSNNVHQYSLSAAYDITTLSYVRSIYTSRLRPFIHQPSNNHTNETYTSLEGIYFVKSETDQYVFLLYNGGDEIITLDRTGMIQSSDTVFEGLVTAKSLNTTGTSLIGDVKFIGGVVMQSPYIQGAMNWSGFNSGPVRGATNNHDALTCGSNVKSIGFTNNTQQNPDSHDLQNTVTGTWLHRPADPQGAANNIMIPASSGTIMLDTDTYHIGRFDSNAESKITNATEDIEFYYTARTDGQGEFQKQLGNLPASGQTLTRTSYYSDKAFADPDTAADWTTGTAYTSTTLASSISQSKDAFLNVQSSGTPPLSTKIVISNHLGSSGFVSGDSDGFGGTSVAYSLRLVNHSYAGSAIRVVNDSDVEADIGFDSNYELDTTALLSHCGSGDGYLVKWYDQAKGGSTGDGNDATWESSTSYSSRKPQIVSSGSVITDNGKPCIETIDAGMIMESEFSASAEYDFFAVCQKTINNGNHGMLFGTQTGNDNRVWFRDHQLNFELNNGETDSFGNFNDDGSNTLRWYQMGQMVFNVRRDSSDVNTAQRNSTTSTFSYTRNGDFRGDRILNNWNNQQYSFGGNVQEIIMLDGDKSSERSAIQSNINTYYSIY